jgi:hypothetical protein
MELILFPFSGNAKEAISVIEEINRMNPTWKIIGFIDDCILVGSNVAISGESILRVYAILAQDRESCRNSA